jgi:GrpB-like predicted nucleotidyltransferase (UPF0157 family)
MASSDRETLAQKIQRVASEDVAIVPYDPRWPDEFRREKEHLLSCLPRELVARIEHIGSTAVPGLASKPIVDMLVEVTDLAATRRRIVPILEAQGYEYFWRPIAAEPSGPFYAWFIKRREPRGVRTHHIHMIERELLSHWDPLIFRDYLIAHPDTARAYETLKRDLAAAHPNDREAYTHGKTAFVAEVGRQAAPSDRVERH